MPNESNRSHLPRFPASLLTGILVCSLASAFALADESEEEPPAKMAPVIKQPVETDSDVEPETAPPAETDNASEAGGRPTEAVPADPRESETGDKDETAAETEPEEDPGPKPFELLGAQVEPGETRRLSWVASESFTGIALPTPVLVAHGVKPGPVLCLTAAIHGDELNGIEMVRRVLYGLNPEKLSGTVVGVPIVNLLGFRRSSRYLPDRRDLNRYFPGDPEGSSASRIAYAFFEDVIRHCDALVDLHTGSFHRTNLPQLRADLDHPAVVKLTRGFGATSVLHSDGAQGTLRRAATEAGIPAVTLEAGEPMRFQPDEVRHGVKGIRTLLNKLGMVSRISLWGEPQPVYYESVWVRAETGGILFSKVSLGQKVGEGELLGTVTDPITNHRARLEAPIAGRILGKAVNQVVIPGFAAYRIGIEKSSEQISQEVEEAPPEPEGDEEEPDVEGDNGNRPDLEEGLVPAVEPPDENERPD